MAERTKAAAARERLLLAGAGALVLAAILTAGYYQQDIATYIRLQGWNHRAPEQVVRSFVRAAYQGDAAGAELLDSQFVRPVVSGSRFEAVEYFEHGPVRLPLRRIVPAPEVEAARVRIRFKAATFQVAVRYPGGRWAAFEVARGDGGLRIVSVPRELTDAPPRPQPWD